MRRFLRFGILNALLLILSIALALAWQHELRRRLALTARINAVLAHPALQISHHQSNRYYKHADISIGGLYFLPANNSQPPGNASLLARLYFLGNGGDQPALSCTARLGPFRNGVASFALTLKQVGTQGLATGTYVARIDCLNSHGEAIATDSIFITVVDR